MREHVDRTGVVELATVLLVAGLIAARSGARAQ
jgi:hypothetical protein